jgi:predicted amidohydrolase
MIIAAAQTHPVRRNIEANIAAHLHSITSAAREGVELIVFPEMSLTAYELEDARSLAFTADDNRLAGLQQAAIENEMTVVCGAPIQINGDLHIGSFIISPSGSIEIYTKQFLHAGEEKFFSPNTSYNPLLCIADQKVSVAICADITNPVHPRNAAARDTSLYLASIFYTPKSIAEAYEQLSEYAKTYRMNIVMANFTGNDQLFGAAGQSACWDRNGELIGNVPDSFEGLLVIDTLDSIPRVVPSL